LANLSANGLKSATGWCGRRSVAGRLPRFPDRLIKGLSLVFISSICLSAMADSGNKRVYGQPSAKTVVKPWQSSERIIIKFAEGTAVRLHDGDFTGLHGLNLGNVKSVLVRHGVRLAKIQPLFKRPEYLLAAEKIRGEQRSGRKLADLSLYYTASLERNANVAAICDALNVLEVIESAVPAPLDAPPPTDISPATPDFTGLQGYRSLATGGIGIDEVAGIPGVDGQGTSFVDVEFGWILDHEDLELPPDVIIDDVTIDNPYNPNHGAAVLGMLVAKDNGYGVTGLIPAANALVSPIKTVEHGSNAALAISNAIGELVAGDVILIESQAWVCGGNAAYGPLEWNQWNFDAIQTATALGIIVVAAAGNGYGNGADDLGVDLDDPACGGLFDRAVRDSGAIIVGAAEALTRNKTGYSTYGSRVDMQGWGDRNVMTTGFGDHFEPEPTDIRQLYTSTFSGTSSAAPIVVGAVLAIQGARLAAGELPLDPAAMRDLLVATGQPQGTGGHIGPLPNVPAALAAVISNLPVVIKIDVDPWSLQNEIDPASNNLIPVAIHSQSIGAGDVIDFDSTQVELTSLKLGVGEAPNIAQPLVGDVDGDGDIDTTVGFRTEQTGIVCGDTEVSLFGSTYSGASFVATDIITTNDCDGASCHP
jgi:serine protease